VLAVAAGLIFLQSGGQQDSPEHSSLSDGPNGTSALSQYAASLGHGVQTVALTFDLPNPPATLFVFNPSPYSATEASRLDAWVRAGGTLVYADDNLDNRLALAFDLHRGNPVPGEGRPVTPALAGVNDVGDDSYAEPYRPTPAQAVLLAYSGGQALVIEEKLGQGRVVAVAAPNYLCNGWLESRDNGRMAADLIGMSPGPVAFDEFHHGLAASTGSGDWTGQPLGLGIFGAALLIFLGLLLRGRAFGPRVQVESGRGRSAAEYSGAVGHLLRQAGGRGLALEVASEATRRSLAGQLGLRSDVPLARLDEVMERRAPALAASYRAAAAQAAGGDRSEGALLAAARRLHDLAYPMARR
jgi:hypothetical protein